jgi:hypothetical protein
MTTVPSAAASRLADAGYRRFLTDLFGVMAYGELSAFERLSFDARFSPTLHDRTTLGRMAVAEFRHYELVSERLAGMGTDVETAMAPFQPAIDAYHQRTRPGDWYESLMKAYVNDAISADFYRTVADRLDPDTRELIGRIHEQEQGDVLLGRLRTALAEDPALGSRLALWGRRLVGEALIQTQRIGVEHSFLGELMRDGRGAQQDADAVAPLLSRLTANHSRRMHALGLTA